MSEQAVCKYCEEGKEHNTISFQGIVSYRMKIKGSRLVITDNTMLGRDKIYKINYCPMCGRKLEGAEV